MIIKNLKIEEMDGYFFGSYFFGNHYKNNFTPLFESKKAVRSYLAKELLNYRSFAKMIKNAK